MLAFCFGLGFGDEEREGGWLLAFCFGLGLDFGDGEREVGVLSFPPPPCLMRLFSPLLIRSSSSRNSRSRFLRRGSSPAARASVGGTASHACAVALDPRGTLSPPPFPGRLPLASFFLLLVVVVVVMFLLVMLPLIFSLLFLFAVDSAG